MQRGVVWVGTDDGQVQLTRDGGKTWENFAKDLPEAPKNGWVPSIEASPKNAGEAFVVLNNYRQNDWQPYLYHTTDFGKKWKRIAGPRNLPGSSTQGGNFCLSVVQDVEVANLLFLGTDQGLYVSVDYGQNWVLWPGEAFPSVPIYDMKIQRRDGDLVLATFGRGIWILDNLSKLREIARAGAGVLDQPFKLFAAQPGILAEFRSYDGPRFAAHATYEGDNKGTGVYVPMWIKPGIKKAEKPKDKKDEEKKEDKADKEKKPEGKGKPEGDAKKKEKITVSVFSVSGDTLRRYKFTPDTAFGGIYWNMDMKGVRFPSKNEPNPDQLEPGNGPKVLPGEYWVKAEYMGYRDSVKVRVLDDPRLQITAAERTAHNTAVRDLHKTVERVTKAYDRLKEAEKTIGLVESQWANVPDSTKKATLKLGSALKDSISVLKEKFFQHKEVKGIQRDPDNLNARMFNALGYIDGNLGGPNAAAQTAIATAKREAEELIAKVNALFDTQWKEYRTKVETVKYSLFKDFEKL